MSPDFPKDLNAMDVIRAIFAVRRFYGKFPHKKHVKSLCDDLEKLFGIDYRIFDFGAGNGNSYYDTLMELHGVPTD